MASGMPTPKRGVMEIEAYVPGESTVPGNIKPIKLSSNENPLGPSPAAVEAFKAAADSLERYPDGSASGLRQAIARVHGLNPDRIVCGAGSDELLNLLAHAYLEPGDEGIFTEHGFLVYRIAILGCGATPVVAPETNLRTDVDKILACVTKTKIVFIANRTIRLELTFHSTRCVGCGGSCRITSFSCLMPPSEYVRRNDYKRASSRRHDRQYGHDADVLEFTAWLLRLGWALARSQLRTH